MFQQQQHTVPITGTGDCNDDNSNTGGTYWGTTQPSEHKPFSMLQKLSQRHTSFKPVSKTFAIVEEEPGQVQQPQPTQNSKLKSWGSAEKINEEPSNNLIRSPSLPILNANTSTTKLLAGSHFQTKLLETPKYHNKITTPQTRSGLSVSKLDGNPKMPLTPQEKLAQHAGKILASINRPSLQSIIETPKYVDNQNRTAGKENILPVQDPISGIKNSARGESWRQQLFSDFGVSPPVSQRKAPQSNNLPVMRNLFDSPPNDESLKSENIIRKESDFLDGNKQSVEPMEVSVLQNMPPTPQHQVKENPFVMQPKTPLQQQQIMLYQNPIQQFDNQIGCIGVDENAVLSRPISTHRAESDIKHVEQIPSTIQHTFKPPPAKSSSDNSSLFYVNKVPYTIGQRLGRGGSSEVYQVVRQSDNQVFALKCVDLRSVDDSIRAGYLNEINLLQRMQGSSRAVQLIDFELCEKRQLLFVVMERGVRDLASFLKDRSKRRDLRLATVEAFWRDMVEAVAAIHERGIIHSDLKPANFLLFGEVGLYQLKLIDFGIASSLQSDMTSVVKETPAGTLNYMSPEAVRGMQGQQLQVKINYKSDVWSLGCILYNLLYGRTPFQHISHPALKADAICNPRHIIDFPLKSTTLQEDGNIPVPLMRVLQSCLNRDPSARPTTQQLLATKYCACEESDSNALETLALGIASLIQHHPMGNELSKKLIQALKNENITN